jgi:hypothetical protein
VIKGTEGSFPSTYLGGTEPLFLYELFIHPRRMYSRGQLVGKIAVKAAKNSQVRRKPRVCIWVSNPGVPRLSDFLPKKLPARPNGKDTGAWFRQSGFGPPAGGFVGIL